MIPAADHVLLALPFELLKEPFVSASVRVAVVAAEASPETPPAVPEKGNEIGKEYGRASSVPALPAAAFAPVAAVALA